MNGLLLEIGQRSGGGRTRKVRSELTERIKVVQDQARVQPFHIVQALMRQVDSPLEEYLTRGSQ